MRFWTLTGFFSKVEEFPVTCDLFLLQKSGQLRKKEHLILVRNLDRNGKQDKYVQNDPGDFACLSSGLKR